MSAAPRMAKLTRPRSDGLLHRDQLFACLDQARSKSVLWIAGPPGAGKTSLVASYLNSRKCPGVWYQVDRNDSDPGAFFYYLSLAVADLRPTKSTPLPKFTENSISDLAGFSRRFFREVFSSLPPKAILVLDNYQEVGVDSKLHAVMKDALEEIPDGIHLIAISRLEPPVEFSRVRATQRLAHLGWEDLKLKREETELIADDPDLDDTTLSLLQEQTSGWAAGVVLMRERMRQAGALKSLNSTDNLETVFDFFADQLFNTADKPTQAMLLHMAYLPRLTTATAEVITGNPDAGRLLANMSKRNLFVDRRIGDETSYQFHALFRAFLQQKAREQLGVAEHQQIAHSAAALLHSTGQLEDAFALYVSSAAWDAIIRLIINQGDRLVGQGRTQTLRQWVKALPLDNVQQNLWMSYWLALSMVAQDHNEAISLLATTFRKFEEQAEIEGQIRCATSAIKIYRRFWVKGNSAAGIQEWITRMIALLPDVAELENETVKCSALCSLCTCMFVSDPDIKELDHVINLLENTARASRNEAMWADAWYALFGIYFHQGNLTKCEDIISTRDSLFDDPAVTITAKLWWIFWKMQCRAYIGDPAILSSLYHQAQHLVDDSGLAPFPVDFERVRVSAHVHIGEYYKALEILKERVEPQLHLAMPHHLALVRDLYARCALAMGDPNAARDHNARAMTMAAEVGWITGRWVMFTTRVQALVATGDLSAARLELIDLRRCYPKTSYPSFEFTFALNDAMVTLREGRLDDAIRLLCDAVEYGAKHSLMWVMGWCPPQFSELFAMALEHEIEVQYARKFIAARHLRSPRSDVEAWPWDVAICAFGSLNVELSGAPVALGNKAKHKVLDLLKVIVALGARHVGRDRLIDGLWPDAEGDAAQKNLDITLHRLRKLLGRDDLVLVQDGKISLNSERCYLDVWAFQYRVQLLKKSNPCDEDYAAKGEAAIKLYPGHLLTSERELTAILGPREALHQEWIATVQRLGAHYESASRWSEAMTVYAQALNIDPTAEQLYRRLMCCQKSAGNRTAAVATYRRCEEQMLNVLGMQPSTETTGLYRSISRDA